jgi:salicylate hydroxylase
MDQAGRRTIVIAGAGIAGLTAALAFAQRGCAVRIFERARKMDEIGAGLQLSPNASRILDRLGVLERLRPHAVAPDAVILVDARSLREMARVPLGKAAEQRWGAAYVVAHRADLQQALLATIAAEPAIELGTGTEITGVCSDRGNLCISTASTTEIRGDVIVGADGVWSNVRQSAGLGTDRFSGQVAWRTTMSASSALENGVLRTDAVTAFLHPGVHLVAYPVRAGTQINLVAVTKGDRLSESWAQTSDPQVLFGALRGAHPRLCSVVTSHARWTAWPLHIADLPRWTLPAGIALVGDAAHAMTPFAAQGAAMAIEDAAVLANLVAAAENDLAGALTRYETLRRPRVARVARRGALNHLAWHARGPVALARNLVLKLRSPEQFAADMDWLYGWDAGAAAEGGVKT